MCSGARFGCNERHPRRWMEKLLLRQTRNCRQTKSQPFRIALPELTPKKRPLKRGSPGSSPQRRRSTARRLTRAASPTPRAPSKRSLCSVSSFGGGRMDLSASAASLCASKKGAPTPGNSRLPMPADDLHDNLTHPVKDKRGAESAGEALLPFCNGSPLRGAERHCPLDGPAGPRKIGLTAATATRPASLQKRPRREGLARGRT